MARTKSLKNLLGAVALSTVLSATAAVPCAFHTYLPDPSLVDLMLGSERIVLARPDPQAPGYFRVVRTLVGPEVQFPIKLDMDATQLAPFDANPLDMALLADDGGYGPWQRLAHADPAYQEIIDRIVPQLPVWSMGGDDERFQMFADLVGHESPTIRTMALKELDRADYSVLRTLSLDSVPHIDVEEIAADDLRPILVLLAGLTGDKSAVPALEQALDAHVATGLPYLGAYSTALLELGGAAAAEAIATTYLRDPAVPLAEREKLLESFAILSRAGAPDTGVALRRITSEVLRGAPELAPAVARQFGFQGDWSQGAAMAEITKTHKFGEIADLFAVNQYVAMSLREATPGQ